jgi:hypothetical protein
VSGKFRLKLARLPEITNSIPRGKYLVPWQVFYLESVSVMPAKVPALGEVASFGTDYFLLKIKLLAKSKRVFTTKFAILPNAC